MIKANKKGPRDGIGLTAIFHPPESAVLQTCISTAVVPEEGMAQTQLREGPKGEAPRAWAVLWSGWYTAPCQ